MNTHSEDSDTCCRQNTTDQEQLCPEEENISFRQYFLELILCLHINRLVQKSDKLATDKTSKETNHRERVSQNQKNLEG